MEMPIWPKKVVHFKTQNLLPHMVNSKEILMFRDIEVEKNNFYRHEDPIFSKISIVKKY